MKHLGPFRKLNLYIFLLIVILLFVESSQAENRYYYIDKLKKTFLPQLIYSLEKKIDLFSPGKAPASDFKVIRFDLNKDGQDEYIISNPYNNGFYSYFWRIYEETNKSYRQIGEMGCTSLRISPETTDGYMNLECYTYLSLVEGYLTIYQHFGSEYFFENRKKIRSKEYYDPYIENNQ